MSDVEGVEAVDVADDAPDDVTRWHHDVAHEWLCHVRACVSEMRMVEDAYVSERCRDDMLGAVRYDREGGRSCLVHGDDSMMAHLLRLERMSDALDATSTLYADEVSVARSVFACLHSHEVAGGVLEMHYIQRRTWGAIATMLDYSESHVKRIAYAATAECYPLMPMRFRDPAQYARFDGDDTK